MTDQESLISKCRVVTHPWVEESLSNILLDKASGWTHNYYRDHERTVWDAEVVRAEDPYEIRIESLRAELEKAVRVEALLDARFKDLPAAPIKQKEKALELWHEASMMVGALRHTLKKTVDDYAKDENIHYLKMRQMQDRYRARFLFQRRNKLMQDGDMGYLKKAVSWVFKYTQSWCIDGEAEAEAEAEAEDEAEAEAGDPAPVAEKVPGLVVFDLDFTVWPFDCHKDRHMPFTVAGGTILDAWGRAASPYPDVPGIITELVERGIPVAYASRNPSADQLEALLRAIAIAPKNRPDIKNLWDVLPSKDYIQAYGSGLSRAKTKHFTVLQRVTGVPFSKMLFFDDDHTNITTAAAQGVIAINVKGAGVKRDIFEGAMGLYKTY
jgi:magnesium-dependent phosphatase 1